MSQKYVYLFSEGNANMRELLGGKGANLAEMTNLGLPIPQGFTVTTEACTKYYEDGEKVEVSGPSPYDPDKDTWHHINSTLTDEEGYYQFNELDSQKRYYVVFEYDGQTYLPTDYKRPEYNTEEWKVTSKELRIMEIEMHLITDLVKLVRHLRTILQQIR